MENNPDMESFERFIKQQSDDFRLYPTKRVWYSLYNNLHPSRKWPSISMCIVLLTALFLIGFLNTNNNHSNPVLAQNANTATKSVAGLSDQNLSSSTPGTYISSETSGTVAPSAEKKVLFTKAAVKAKQPVTVKHQQQAELIMPSANKAEIVSTETNNSISTTSADQQLADITDAPLADKLLAETLSKNNLTATFAGKTAKIVTKPELTGVTSIDAGFIENTGAELQKLQDNNTIIKTSFSNAAITPLATAITDEYLSKQVVAASNTEKANKNVVVDPLEKSWIENYAMYNKPAPKKWKGKLAWQAYFTPSVSYRKLFNNAANKNVGGLNAAIGNSADPSLSKQVTQSASIGLEAGIGLQYPVFKGVKVKGGLQLNYTRYNISAFANSHPTTTSLEMLSEVDGRPYELYKNTAYSNNSGLIPVTLHNQTVQLSLPVGADIKLAGNDLFEWYAGAAIQPTFVFGSITYLISTDRRNYVKDNSMLNHFNMNAAFETYISFKSAGGLTWQIGPQLRKQLYSTNSRLFTVEERLMGYGLKVGFIKKL